MKKCQRILILILIIGLLLTACSSTDQSAAPEATKEEDEIPAWFDMPMKDVQTGETFTISDLSGKVILIETMAMWCPTCLKQEKEVKMVLELLGDRDDFIIIAMDVDPNENATALKAYIQENELDWIFVIPSIEIKRDISNRYTAQLLNPPTVPMLIIDRNGDVYGLPFGVKGATALHNTILTYLDDE
jgi:cytochrome oxidase Cu insertion factor (SCO1/SenC/PrrC family)